MGVGHLPVFSLVWDVIAEGSEVSLLLQEIVFSRWKKTVSMVFAEKKRIPMVCKTSEFPLQWSCASKNTDTRELVVGWVAFCRWRLIYSSRGYDINHDPSGGGATCYPLVILATGNFPFKRLLIDCLDKQRAVGFLGKVAIHVPSMKHESDSMKAICCLDPEQFKAMNASWWNQCQTLVRTVEPMVLCNYCGWKKSCTTLDGWNPINNGKS